MPASRGRSTRTLDCVNTVVHAPILASYIDALKRGADSTQRAEGRGIYTSLLADAATVLAISVQGRPPSQLLEAAHSHERLRGQVWLQDPAQTESSKIWSKAYGAIGEHAI